MSRVVSRIYDEELRGLGLKMSQLNVLVFAVLNPGAKAVEIGQGLHLEKSTLSRNLARMSERGWLTTDDGVSATAEGERLLGEAAPRWKRAQARIRSELGADAAAALAAATAGLWE